MCTTKKGYKKGIKARVFFFQEKRQKLFLDVPHAFSSLSIMKVAVVGSRIFRDPADQTTIHKILAYL